MKQLKGRYGYYTPRNPVDLQRARREQQKHGQQRNDAADWLERTRWCINGCGKEAARYSDSPGQALRHDGACSVECAAAVRRRESKDWP